jgi:hypothetical protein
MEYFHGSIGRSEVAHGHDYGHYSTEVQQRRTTEQACVRAHSPHEKRCCDTKREIADDSNRPCCL